ncbi:MAG TPA: metalloregulator ArsR/SmtB family transcription factor [Candidatus Paceibacterota bacterium]
MSSRIVELERVLKALANRRRLMIIKFLLSKKSASVGDIADHIKLSIAATSRHLRQLANADILKTDQLNTTVNYSLVTPRELISVLRLTT